MVNKADKNVARLRRHRRVRGKISGTCLLYTSRILKRTSHMTVVLKEKE